MYLQYDRTNYSVRLAPIFIGQSSINRKSAGGAFVICIIFPPAVTLDPAIQVHFTCRCLGRNVVLKASTRFSLRYSILFRSLIGRDVFIILICGIIIHNVPRFHPV